MEDSKRYYQAKKRVNEIRGFYGNLSSFILVNLFLMVINLVTSRAYLWFIWPFLSWGIGVLIHGMIVFKWLPFFGKEWEEKKIQEFLEIEKNKEKKYL